ncbi:MAG: sulfite exporter TauE/SafE family protein [Rhodospirillales bacterium]|nr:sulfite exporter TauE/SafE family protein [Rhodospirillales bacterium]
MIADLWFYALAVPAVLLAGVSKGGFGSGLVVLAVPLMSLVVPPPQAAAIMLPILVVMDLTAFWTYRKSFDRGHLKAILPAAAIGVGLGWATFGLLDASAVRLLVGVLALVFPLAYWLDWKPPRVVGPPKLWGGLWGAVSGFTSFVAHAGGPPILVYLLPQQLEKRLFVGTLIVFFMIVNALKLVPYGQLGQFHVGNLLTSAVLLPLAPLGIWLGLWMQNRIPDRAFYGVCYTFLFLTGLKLCWDGVAGMV